MGWQVALRHASELEGFPKDHEKATESRKMFSKNVPIPKECPEE